MSYYEKVVQLIRTFLLKIRSIGHTVYIAICKSHLIIKISAEISGALNTPSITTCKDCLTDQNMLPKKSEALYSHTMLEHAKII